MAKQQVHYDRDKQEFVGLSEDQLKDLAAIYKDVDIDIELKKMGLWLTSQKGRGRKGNIGFILNWLGNVKKPPYTVRQSLDLMESDSPVSALLNDYLQDLWKDREHIHKFNLITRTP